jgi:hypothetical protein
MTASTRDSDIPVVAAPPDRPQVRVVLDRLGRALRERWAWYQRQQREDRERHWWDVYNR